MARKYGDSTDPTEARTAGILFAVCGAIAGNDLDLLFDVVTNFVKEILG